jgi:tetratricopeptide (TPR) repeat protein
MQFKDNDSDMEELVKRYEQSLKEGHPGYFDVDELEDISEYYRTNGKRNESTDVIEMGLRLHPENSVLLLRRATLFAEIGEYKRALKILDRLPVKNNTEVRLLRAEILLHLNKEKEGVQLLHEILESEQSDVTQLCLDISSILSDLSMYELSKEFLMHALQNDENSIELLEELAYCNEQTQNYRQAIRIYDKMLDIDPYMGEIWFNMGQDYFNLEEYNKAVEAYDFALAISEEDSLACLQKAHALFQANRFLEAAEAYKEYIDGDEPSDIALVFLGESYEKAGMYDEAIAKYTEAYNMNIENFDACTGLAICYMENKEYQQSLSWFDKALRINEEDAEIWVYLAELLLQMELKDEAYVSYLRSLALKKDQADVLAAMGNISFDKGEYGKALSLYKIADFIDSELPGLKLFFALTYAKLGDTKNAAEYLEKAKLNDENAERFYNEIMSEEGNTDIDIITNPEL